MKVSKEIATHCKLSTEELCWNKHGSYKSEHLCLLSFVSPNAIKHTIQHKIATDNGSQEICQT